MNIASNPQTRPLFLAGSSDRRTTCSNHLKDSSSHVDRCTATPTSLSQLVTRAAMAACGNWPSSAPGNSKLCGRHDMNRLLVLLAAKQKLLVALQSLERQLDPFRRQRSEPKAVLGQRRSARKSRRRLAAESETLLAQIVCS